MVTIEERCTEADAVVGVATLNNPAKINVLTLPMAETLLEALEDWKRRDEVQRVLLTAAGERGFCAGGDVVALYHAMVRNQQAGEIVDPLAETFFEREYRLGHAIRTFPKPFITHGFGIVMGGGMGMFSGGSVRLATSTSRFAYPEVSIGLFPDAGATVLLQSLPVSVARFFGITGCALNATDALALDMATHLIEDDTDVVQLVCRDDWQDTLANQQAPEGNSDLAPLRGRIDAELGGARPSIEQAIAAVRRIVQGNDWGQGVLQRLEDGCPTTVGIVLEQIERSRNMTIADCYRLEMVLAVQCARGSEFAEGVRAVLVDKDRTPKWKYGWDNVPDAFVQEHFNPPWPRNPLHDIDTD